MAASQAAPIERSLVGVGAVLAVFVAVESVNEGILLLNPSAGLPLLVPVSLVMLGAILASLPGSSPLDLSATLIVVMAAVSNLIIFAQHSPGPSGGFLSTRFVWASTILLLMLALRGRLRCAWLGMLAVLALQAGLSLGLGSSGTPSLSASIGAAGLLTIGTLFFAGLARTTRRTNAAWQSQSIALAEQAAFAAVTEARREHTKRLLGVAGPLLERISEGRPLTAEERLECVLVEGSLRDAARAPGLSGEALSGAVREARRRGVQVTLFDDRQGELLTPMEQSAITGWMLEQLGSLSAGSFTARLLPADRGPLATVVISDGEETRALEFAGGASA